MSLFRASVLMVSAMAGLFPLLASAQDFPKAEVFGGYSYLHLDTHGTTTASLTQECNVLTGGACPATFKIRPGFNGWEAAGQFNLNSWLGVKADFAGHYGNILSVKFNTPLPFNFAIPDQHIYDFLFGPVLSQRGHRYTAFAHVLFGAEHVGIGSSPIIANGLGTFTPPSSETDFSFALGGGIDFKVSRHLSIRAGQFDYQFVNSSGGSHSNDFRFSAGVVGAFGGK